MIKLARIEEPIAKGLALGTSAHAIGTAKAMELGEIEAKPMKKKSRKSKMAGCLHILPSLENKNNNVKTSDLIS